MLERRFFQSVGVIRPILRCDIRIVAVPHPRAARIGRLTETWFPICHDRCKVASRSAVLILVVAMPTRALRVRTPGALPMPGRYPDVFWGPAPWGRSVPRRSSERVPRRVARVRDSPETGGRGEERRK